ncbi:MAG: hypothetical protein ACO1PB_15495 [Ramlibacter sp.]
MPLLSQVLELNARFPAPESERFALTTAADTALAAYAGEPEPTPELTFAVILLLRSLKRYDEALALMQQRRPVLAERAREIDFYEMELHFLAGRAADGERLLGLFEGAGPMRPSWRRSLATIRDRGSAEAAGAELAALEEAIAELRAGVDAQAHMPLLETVTRDRTEAIAALRFVQDRLDLLQALDAPAAAADLAVFDKHHVGRLLFTCGFSWSGSGAVSGFLSQHKSVTMPFGMSELGYLQGRAGRKGVCAFLDPAARSFDGMKKQLARFFIESVVCLRTLAHPYSVLTHCLRAPGGRVLALGELVDDFHRQMLSADALAQAGVRRRIVARFLQRLFSIQGGTHILLNNVFMAPRVRLLGDLEDAVFIVVERDARDQFVARRAESPEAAGQPLQEFATMLARSRAQYRQICDSLPPEVLAARRIGLRFEDFVRNDGDARERLLDRLGLPRAAMVADKARFDPAVSVRNVGIHAGQLAPAEIAWIDAELGVYLP